VRGAHAVLLQRLGCAASEDMEVLVGKRVYRVIKIVADEMKEI
jgi:hypothetical protein